VLTIGTLSGLVGSETLGVTGSAANYASANADTYAGVAITYVLTDGTGGGLAANYALAAGTATGVVTPKTLSIGSPALASREYDGTTAPGALTIGTLAGLIGSETLGVTGSAANYASANADTYAGVAITYTLADGTGGGLAANYALAAGTATGVVTPKTLSIGSPALASREYDGTTAPGVLTTGTLAGLIGSETLGVTGSAANYAGTNADTYAGVAITYVLTDGTGGGLAANYALADSTATGVVTPKTLSIAGLTASPKIYDGTPAVTVAGAPAYSGLAGGETFPVAGTVAWAFADANVGDEKPLVRTGSFAAPNANYTVTQPALSAAITPRAVTVRARDASRLTTDVLTGGPGSTAFDADGLAVGETIGSVSIAYGPAAAGVVPLGRYAGQVTPSAATGGSFSPANYRITYTAGDIVVFTLNQPPTAVTLANVVASLPENTPTTSPIRLADIVVVDDGLGDVVLALSGPDADVFGIVDGMLFLRAGTVLDFEARPFYDVTITAADPGIPGQTTSTDYRLSIANLNETPSRITLSNTTIPENAPAGTVIGAFTTADPDAGEVFTYTLVPGAGADDNASFTIDGGRLLSAVPFNHELEPTLSVRVRATDAGGASIEAVFTISVTDVDEPLRIEGIRTPTGLYRVGDTLRFTVILTRPVVVTGRPVLQFGVGRNASAAVFGTGRRNATYAEGSGTNRLTFTYRVKAGDDAAAVFFRNAIAGNRRSSIRDAEGTVLNGRLPMAGQPVPGVQIDTKVPRPVGRIELPSAAAYATGDTLTFRVNFSENVLVTGTPVLDVRVGVSTRSAAYVSGSGTRQLTFTYTIAGDDTTVGRRGITAERSLRLTGGATIADAARNAARLTLSGPFAAVATVNDPASPLPTPSSRGPLRAPVRAAAFAAFGR